MTKEDFYKKGDVIGGKYEVRDVLGEGGFGIVYLVYDRELGGLVALKTFRYELLVDPKARDAFRKECLLWVNLEEPPHILAARWVTEASGRLFVSMDYVPPDSNGRVSLYEHLAGASGPLDTNQVLGWAIQFCSGMEHAGARGLGCHRDIKPGNILIAQDWSLKIADFGLAGAAAVAWSVSGGRVDSLVTGARGVGFGFSIMRSESGVRCGTPGYMAPEVYRCERADVRSDIYSFGLVLWQMAEGSRAPPFMGSDEADSEGWVLDVYEQQMAERLPPSREPLGPIIERCLRAEPSAHYVSFQELHGALETVWRGRTGVEFPVPRAGQKTAAFWNNKGGALGALGRHEQAMSCFDKALAIEPGNAVAWNNKGSTLNKLSRYLEAVECFDNALGSDSRNLPTWVNKGLALENLERREEAIECFDKALAIDPRNVPGWGNKGIALERIGRSEEAIRCYDKALAIDPRFTEGWINKSGALGSLRRYEEAISCVDRALAIDPLSVHAWFYRGVALDEIGRIADAMECFGKVLSIDPQFAGAWVNMGTLLYGLGRHEEASMCFDKALQLNPQNPMAWFNKGVLEDAMGHLSEAVSSYRRFIELGPVAHTPQTGYARQRVRELES